MSLMKEEMDCENGVGVSEAAARAGLYADHEVKHELVIGPETLQQPSVPSAIPASDSKDEMTVNIIAELEDQSCVKIEPMEIKSEPESFEDQLVTKQTGNFIECSFTRMHLFEIWCTVQGSPKEKKDHVLEVFINSLKDCENIDFGALEKRVTVLCTQISSYWKSLFRIKSKVISKYSDWLNMVEFIKLSRNDSVHQDTQPSYEDEHAPSHSRRRPDEGRPRKDFAELSKLSQRRLAELSQVDNSTVNALFNVSSEADGSEINVSADEVLSLFVQAKLTKHQYLLIKNFVNTKTSCNILPSYQSVLKAKEKCYPKNISVSGTTAEIELQNLLDHTVSRILESQKNILDVVESSDKLTLIGKWGFDGSTGHSEYKQCFTDSSSDSSLFVTSYVPLQLVANFNSDNSKIIWKNPRPSSTRYCRPIRFQFLKETSQVSINEEAYFKEKCSKLNPTCINIHYQDFQIKHVLQLTMVDGKVCTALMDSSSSKCYICGATPKEMNQIDLCLKRTTTETGHEFGLSALHAHIRFFEYFLHLSYRINIKKWQVRSDNEIEMLAKRKLYVQTQFRKELGLIVDKPRSGGSGTSNYSNTARRFFKYSDKSSEITGLNKSLIDRCGIILEALSSGFNINSDKFRQYALKTARLLVKEYPWCKLPTSVHKILIHGAEVIEKSLLSLGELSEEAAESKNKHLKSIRRQHTRKMSRELTNTDLMHRLLLASDPFITGLRKLPRKNKNVLSRETIKLLDV